MKKIMTVPWPTDNPITRSWRPNDLILLCSRPGFCGVTGLLTCALWAWAQGRRVLIASTETNRLSLLQRLAVLADEGSYNWLGNDRISVMPDGGVTLASLEAAIIETKPDMVFVDGLYNVAAESREALFNGVKAIALRHPVMVVGTTLLNRHALDKQPTSSWSALLRFFGILPKNQVAINLYSIGFTTKAAQVADWVFAIEKAISFPSLTFTPLKSRR